MYHFPWTSRVAEFAALPPRPVGQLFVWANSEAPGNFFEALNASAGLEPPHPLLDAIFNASLTYRQDPGNVLFSYGGFSRRQTPLTPVQLDALLRPLFAGKRSLAAWAASHCVTASRREDYVALLRRSVSVDVFGKCGGLAGVVAGRGHERLAAKIHDRYHFYLAFENRLCKDYVTEKFWIDALLAGAIPVVRGGLGRGDYAAVAPPGSYLDVDDFESPEELGRKMEAVASNFSLWATFHAWRAAYCLNVTDVHWARSRLSENAAVCRLCGLLVERAAQEERHRTWRAQKKASRLGGLAQLIGLGRGGGGEAPPPAPEMRLKLSEFWDARTVCRAPVDVPGAAGEWGEPVVLCGGARAEKREYCLHSHRNPTG